MEKHKHLDLDARITIELELGKASSFKEIASILGKDCTTVSKEVRAHRVFQKSGAYGRPFNDCEAAHNHACDERMVCGQCSSGRGGGTPCWSCGRCAKACPSYKRFTCPRLGMPPYVCNGCPDRRRCSLEKAFYKAASAQKEYELVRSESRSGFDLTEDELAQLDRVISPRITRGQSLHNIAVTGRDEVMRSERTLYAYMDAGLFSARNIDMPRKVRMSPRKNSPRPIKVDRACREGRSYKDYTAYTESHPGSPVVQMDSVEGAKGRPVLLTLHFLQHQLQVAFLREANNSRSVTDIFERLYLELGPETFTRLFPVILTDNGSEFSNPKAIEQDMQGNPRSKVFYCDPGSPFQKGGCENNHELIRRCIPKGVDIGQYTQGQITLMMSHINSYARPNLGDRSPYDVFSFEYGEAALRVFGLERIPAGEVNLTPGLFR